MSAVPDEEPVGLSRSWQRIECLVRAAAETDSAVLVSGEPGCGKTTLARRVHALSPRSCGRLVELRTELERSLHLADRGTLLVDEVGGLSVDNQAALLRFLQRREAGAPAEGSVPDVRVVATSQFDLNALVRRGRLSADLLHRMSAIRIHVPPLRERLEDIRVLADHFARDLAARMGRAVPELSAFTCGWLEANPWPENARELRKVVERALLSGPGEALEYRLSGTKRLDALGPSEKMPELHLRRLVGRFERRLVIEALRRAGGGSAEAARLLGISPKNLGYFVRKHDLPPRGVHRVSSDVGATIQAPELDGPGAGHHGLSSGLRMKDG